MGKLKYSLLVLLGACSYGTVSTIMKLALKKGFGVQHVIGGQYVFGWLMLLLLMLLFSRVRIPMKQVGQLLLAGIPLCTTSILYSMTVAELPASIAVLLLFQFTWIGVFLEAVWERKFPSRVKLISVVVLLIGTVLAGGLLEAQAGGAWSLKGVLLGIASAVSFAVSIFLSGKVAIQVPVISRTFVMVTGALVVCLLYFTPHFLLDGSLAAGAWKYSFSYGMLCTVGPVLLFAIGMPKIGSGLGGILGAAELPTAVIVSVIVLHEVVSGEQWVGIIIILLGITLPSLATIPWVANLFGALNRDRMRIESK